MSPTRSIDPTTDDAVRRALQGILWVVCPGMFAAAAFLCGIDHPGAPRAALASLAAAVVLSGLTLRWWRRPARSGHGAAALVIVILQLCMFIQIRAMSDPVLVGFQLLVVVGIAAYVVDPRWMFGLQLSGLAAWLAATGAEAATPQWQVARFVLAIGYVTAGAFYFGRRHSFDRMRDLQIEGERQRTASFESQEALRTSERRLRDAQRIAHVGSFEWDLAADELRWSDEHYRIFGWEPGSPVNNERFLAAVHPDDRERIGEAVRRSLRDGSPVELEYRFVRPDGEERFIHGRGETERDADGKPIRHQGTSYDITDRQRVQNALEASEARLTAILTAMDAARAVVIARDGVVRSILGTPDRTGRYGVGELQITGRRIHDFLPGEAGDRVMAEVARVYETGARAEVDATLDFPKGTFHFDVSLRALRMGSGEIESVLAIVRDMTDQRTEAKARRRAQKLESLGVLAGGVAHDFNNLLVGILSNAETALEVLGPDSPARSGLEDIFNASSQAADLTQELLTYAGGARFSPASLDLFDLVEETAHLIRPNLPEGVTLDLLGESGEVWIHADVAQIRQVVMNFLTNAAEATAGKRAEVTVQVDVVELDQSYLDSCYLRDGVATGSYARVEVTDRGIGMDRETQEQIFDPFFTTKFQGRGLGLASTVGIVRAHGGTLRVTSEPGRGTRFTVLLPRIAPISAAIGSAPSPAAAPPARILVVDDQALVRTAIERMLRADGHAVTTVSGGQEAVARFSASPERFDLAVIDVTMPGMDGEQTFEALRAVDGELPVIFVSGHSSDEVARRIAGKARVGCLTKPFRNSQLERAIATLLQPPD